MSKLYFYYSSMNSGKSTTLLQAAFNYKERGMDVMLFNFHGDNRMGEGTINSRIGLSAPATLYDESMDIYKEVSAELKKRPFQCVLIDEAQFLTEKQVWQLTDICDLHNIPVLAYGLRTDFRGQLFEGSKYLLAWSNALKELKGVCHCGSKTSFVLRKDSNGNFVTSGDQISIGGEEQYVSVCRMHYKEAINNSCE